MVEGRRETWIRGTRVWNLERVLRLLTTAPTRHNWPLADPIGAKRPHNVCDQPRV